MWREYRRNHSRHNRSLSMSVTIGALISSLLLSLLCGLFYNMWKYEIERMIFEEGGWQSRLEGELNPEDIEAIRNFAGIKDVVTVRKEGRTVWELYFDHMGDVLEGTEKIAALTGISPEAVTYHHGLLAMYLVRDPKDPAPRLVFALFLMTTAMACVSLIAILHNAFAVSMNERTRQFGILSSIGATPAQIRACLLREAAMACAVPVAAGNLMGILITMGLLKLIDMFLGEGIPGRHPTVFGCHPLVLASALLVTIFTIWISAWLPARRLSRMTPLEAIKHWGEPGLKRRRSSPAARLFFGIEGELAGNAIKAREKALRTASLSLVCSFLAFTLMECFFTMSKISTEETYFKRYENVWDIMVTVKDARVDSFEETEKIRGLAGVDQAIVYKKARAQRLVREEELSSEMKALGGFGEARGQEATRTGEGRLVSAPIIILDDDSFLDYCGQIGGETRLEGAVIRNRIKDVTNPDFRHSEYVPYVTEKSDVSLLKRSGGEEPGGQITAAESMGETEAEVLVLCYTDQAPALREEYGTEDRYELVHVLSASLWREIRGQVGGEEEDIYICVLAKDRTKAGDLDRLEEEICGIIGRNYRTESENRIEEQELNDRQIRGMMAVFGGFCALLAVIGVGSVFSDTLGFVRQRRREFARYRSVGLTPAGIRKMFWIEALVIGVRPVLITLPVSAAAVWYMLKLGYLEGSVFWSHAPFGPVLAFLAAVWGAVALAYYLGWRKVRDISLAEVLRDDTMM